METKYGLNLQKQLSITMTIFAVLIAVVVGGAGYTFNERIEFRIWEQTLESELKFYIDRKNENPSFEGSEKYAIKVYEKSLNGTGSEGVPAQLVDLSTGLHDEFAMLSKQFCVLVKDVGDKRYFITYDISEIEKEEKILALTAVLGLISFSALIFIFSIKISNWLLAPLKKLSEEVANLEPSDLNLSITGSYYDDEINVIATAMNRFLDRLRQFIFREHEFLSTASHELRTPIAVISGACDVLSLNKSLPSEIERPIARILRSANDMKSIINALMYLAKEGALDNPSDDSCELSSIVVRAIDDHRYLIKDKRIEVRTNLEITNISAPEAMASIAIGNLIRNAFQHTSEGKVEVSLCEKQVTVEDTGPGMAHSLISESSRNLDPSKRQSKGFGLYIIRKICERFGWNLNISTSPLGTIALIDFNKDLKQ